MAALAIISIVTVVGQFPAPRSTAAVATASSVGNLKTSVVSGKSTDSVRTSLADARDAITGSEHQLRTTYSGSGAAFDGKGFKFTVEQVRLVVELATEAMSPKWVGTNTGATYGMGAITETFRPAVNGTEQSFTVANRPKGSGPLVILVPVLGLSAHTSGAAIDLDNPAGQVVATYAGLKVTDANDKTVPAVMKAVTDGSAIAIDVSDSGASYPLTVDPTWSQTEEIGRSGNVAVLGSTALVGEPDQTVDGNTYEGAVYVYTLSGYGWVESAELTASDGTAGDTFGYSVALSGTSAIIGAPDHTVGSTTYQGAAYVFTFNSGRWTQTAELTNSGGVVEGNFGFSVGLSGTTAVVGAIGMDTTGAAFVFNLSDGSWSQTAVLTPPDYGYIGFGYSVGISGTTLVVGAPGEYVYAADAGTAYIYSLIDGTWTEGATEISSDGGNYELFGEKVAVSGSTVLVSAEGRDD